MFIWDEVTAGREADEIASCMIKWLNIRIVDKAEEFVILHIFCDSYEGENKNFLMLLMTL